MQIVRAAQEGAVEFAVVEIDIRVGRVTNVHRLQSIEAQQLQRTVEHESVADVVIMIWTLREALVAIPAHAVMAVDFAGRADHQYIRHRWLLHARGTGASAEPSFKSPKIR